MATKGPRERGEFWWRALATSSLPVPDSPTMSTVDRVGAATRSRSRSSSIATEWPTMPSKPKLLFEALAQPAILVRQHSPLELKLHPLSQLLHLDRFRQVVVGALLESRHGIFHLRIGGNQQER